MIMSLFHGTVGFYRQFRPDIPAEVADVLDAAAPAGSPRRLLDIGTGTGLVVEALRGRFDDILAIDPDPEMLSAAESALRPRLPADAQLRLHEARAEEFTPPPEWQADLVTICRTFHWLDQDMVLTRLHAQVSPEGAVAILADKSFWVASNDWELAVRAVIEDFLGEQRRAGEGAFQEQRRPDLQVLRDSPFNQVEEHTVPVRRTWTANSILGYLHSTSFAEPELFGDRLSEFDRAVRTALASYSDTDTFIEENEFLIHIGRRGQA
ncbi:class I SAM-dependent methyltransferase [Salinispora arenicola]|uniref:class I SAM-dependent methyltransferase n=1 Tax=Salinispora arenicola TaxID=168697 RepID=UPI0016A1C560|nr:class I SAM-dependent methyltransferase [Salinispora arenicola]NIL55911.1 class I SAM-dependent methyltransferase [Salinispora arenicola]NIL60598.1 class I SAM-dependent methyltransferase [Salinispora arenicola]